MSKNTPLVSLGLPVFNGEEFLASGLESILNQSFEDFEVVISDNASTDGTGDICRFFMKRDKRIRYHRMTENVGAAKNFNSVFEQSSSRYFKWISHDDVCAPTFLERCVEVLDSEDSVVVAYPRSLLIDQDGNEFGRYSDNLHLRSCLPSERLRSFFDNPGLCHPVFGLIRAATLRQTPLIGNYPRSDRNLLGELALHGQFYEIPEELFYRRIHPNTSTEANVTEAELAVWFDPANRNKRVFPKWRRLIEYLKAIARVPLGLGERTLCCIHLARFVLVPEKWKGLLVDLWLSGKLLQPNPSRK